MIRFDELEQTDVHQQFVLELPRKQFGATCLDSNYITVTLIELDTDEEYARFESLDQTEEERIYFDEQHAYKIEG